MNKKMIYIIAIFLLILIFSLVIYWAINKNNDYVFNLDSNNKYEIITDMRWDTMRNDGGSHTNIYYQVDLDNNSVSKIQEVYHANLGGTPNIEKSIIYTKKIDSNIEEEAKTLLDDIILKEDINETHNYNFFTILSLNSEKDIFNINTIKDINNFLQKIDEL